MKRIPIELCIWVVGLLFVSIVPPSNFSICLFHHLGFTHCPGCGLGHSIYYLVHGEWQQSFEANPLGAFALTVLLFRIYKLIIQFQSLQLVHRNADQIKSTQ